MELADFDFVLPDEAIARRPAEARDRSRLMVLMAGAGPRHRRFFELPDLLRAGDLLVVNDSKVLKARLAAKKVGTGGAVEVLLVEPVTGADDRHWRAMVNASKPVRPGHVLAFPGAEAEVTAAEGEGFVTLRLSEPALSLTERVGAIPLPPYMARASEPEDDERYQTLFAQRGQEGSVAAPTAGLHFTNELMDALTARGVERAAITLHVGPGTFLPVRVERIEDHRMHAERFVIPEATIEAIARTKAQKGRVIAVGTTVVRTLESGLRAGPGSTSIFIRPGHVFTAIDGMITNFHLPRSTLLMLVSAFAGRDRVLSAYQEALAEGYRFYSYGDAMLIA